MKDLLLPGLNEYMTELLPPRHPKFYEMEAYARERNFPIIGPLAGNFLAQQAAAIGARRIMELGSGFGYSAFWFSTVLPADGTIVCTDGNEENAGTALQMFRDEGKEKMLEFLTGDALTRFGEVEGEFDIIFCDIDKHEYPQAFEMAFPRVRKGGFIAFDNCLWSGRMLESDESPATKGIVELNRRAFNTPGCRTSIIPIRDGILLCYKM